MRKHRMIVFIARTLAACASCSAAAGPLQAQPAWPSKPVRVVVAFPPGGIVDTVARQLQPRLQAALGQPVIIDNRGGAGGTVGSAEVAKAAPDGHTLLMVFDSYATYPLVYPKLTFDIAKDLQPVTQIASNPLILVVNPKVPAADFKSFVGLLKSQPGQYNYASVGPGSSNHLTAELFKAQTGTFVTHIPYRGGGPAQQDLLGGQVEMMFLSAVLAQPHVKAGKLRALAQTGAQRVPAYARHADRGRGRLARLRSQLLGGLARSRRHAARRGRPAAGGGAQDRDRSRLRPARCASRA